MPDLTGTFVYQLCAKGRLVIPCPWRAALGNIGNLKDTPETPDA